MTQQAIAVIGATGKTGERVIAGLSERGRKARALSRTTPIPFHWKDRRTWPAALDSVRAGDAA